MRPYKKRVYPKLDSELAEIQIQQFTPDDKVLMGLYFYESLSINEIAKILYKKPEIVQSRLEYMVSRILKNSYPLNGVNLFSNEKHF